MKIITKGNLQEFLDEHKTFLENRKFGEYKPYDNYVFEDVTIENTDLSYSEFYYSEFNDSKFYNSKFNRSRFNRSIFHDSKFNYSKFNYSKFYFSEFDYSEFDYSEFNHSEFYVSKFYNSEFNHCIGVKSHEDQINKAKEIYNIVKGSPDKLNMEAWHTCETVHCIAGWCYPKVEEPAQIASQSYPFLSQYFYKDNEDGMKALKELASGNLNYCL